MPNFSGIWTVTQQMQATGQSIWPAVPGAPTIGTATATGATTATVAFTAPANTGYPATITGYTATSSPGGLTGTGASSPITVSGLTAGTAYTFTVTATNATGTGPASAASNSVTPIPAIGTAFGGGFYAGQIGVSSVATHFIVIGPLSTAQTINQWKTGQTATAGTSSVIDGPANTAAMIAAGAANHPCGQFCDDLVIGGFSDWYMPARNELEVCYFNLKPTTTSNNTSSGINPNAVPARASNYTSGNPAQTSAASFQSGGAEPFASGSPTNIYWSSTEASAAQSRPQIFNTGYQNFYANKTSSYTVRAVRRVAV